MRTLLTETLLYSLICGDPQLALRIFGAPTAANHVNASMEESAILRRERAFASLDGKVHDVLNRAHMAPMDSTALKSRFLLQKSNYLPNHSRNNIITRFTCVNIGHEVVRQYELSD